MTEAIRRFGIGGSQAAAAVGLNDWCAPVQLWQALVEDFEVPDTPAMKWGRILEPAIRQEYAEQMHAEIVVPEKPIYRDWMRATVDGIVLGPDGKWDRLLEIKTAGAQMAENWGEAGTDHVPLAYATQCAWYLHVLELPRADLAALIGGRDFRIYHLERDREFERDLVEAVTEFWERYVIPREPPPADASTEYRDYLARRYAKTSGALRPATAEEEELVVDLMVQRVTVRFEERKEQLLENRLRGAIADADGLEGRFGRVTMRTQVRRTVDWRAVAEVLAARERLSEDFLKQLAEEHTKESEPFRPLRLPKEERDR